MNGPTAVVVGGAGAIGEACAAALLRDGFRVAVADVDRDRAGLIASRLGADTAAELDVTSTHSVRTVLDELTARWGRLDAAVNLAAVAGPPHRLHHYDDEDWDRVIDVNLTGMFRCLREQLRIMSELGTGSVVAVSSVGAGVGFAGASAYSATKHGVTGLVRSAALEYAAEGIRVNALMPGFVDTPFLRSRRSAEELEGIAAAHPLGRLATADEVAGVVSFLVSPAAAFVTGSCYEVDGGFLAGRGAATGHRTIDGV